MRSKHLKAVLCIVLSVLLGLVCLSGCLLLKNGELRRDLDMYQKISLIKEYIDAYSIYDFDEEVAEDAALKYYLYGIDGENYAYYFNEEELEEFNLSTRGGFIGIGVNVVKQQNQNGVSANPDSQSDTLKNGLLVYRVLGNSPAEKAGLKAGDYIIEGGGKSFIGITYDDAVDIMLGEEGTVIDLKVMRDNHQLSFSITRESFVQRLIDYDVIGDIGFIRIHEFSFVAKEQFANALEELISAGVKGFVFDVRNNPGGELNTVTDMLDLLVPNKEPIVIIQYKSEEEVIYSREQPKTNLPAVVLINNSSASASELFASCLRDLNGVPLIGERSFGKGVGQTTFNLGDGTGLKLTTFRYLTKSKTDYNGTGLVPDHEVATTEDQIYGFYKIGYDEDDQLQKAIEVLGKLIEK